MSIRVTCTGCHTRFNVSEKFAGKDGPCPKCKKTIQIPAVSEEVKVHAPEGFGPKTTAGKAVFKPIARKETRLSAVQIVLIAATILGFLLLAFMVRSGVSDKEAVSWLVLLLGAFILAVPCVYAGYGFLRNQDLGAFQGQELWTRVAACAGAYGISWLAIPIVSYAVGPEIGTFIGLGVMIVAGAAAAYLFLQIDFFMGLLHYGLFLGCSILLRVIAGFSALPRVEASGSDIDDMLNAQQESPTLVDITVELCHFLI